MQRLQILYLWISPTSTKYHVWTTEVKNGPTALKIFSPAFPEVSPPSDLDSQSASGWALVVWRWRDSISEAAQEICCFALIPLFFPQQEDLRPVSLFKVLFMCDCVCRWKLQSRAPTCMTSTQTGWSKSAYVPHIAAFWKCAAEFMCIKDAPL